MQVSKHKNCTVCLCVHRCLHKCAYMWLKCQYVLVCMKGCVMNGNKEKGNNRCHIHLWVCVRLNACDSSLVISSAWVIAYIEKTTYVHTFACAQSAYLTLLDSRSYKHTKAHKDTKGGGVSNCNPTCGAYPLTAFSITSSTSSLKLMNLSNALFTSTTLFTCASSKISPSPFLFLSARW